MGTYCAPTAEGLKYRYQNGSVPAGVSSTAETAFGIKATIPGGTLGIGSDGLHVMSGYYDPAGLSQNIIPRVRIGAVGTALASMAMMLNQRTVTGLLGANGSPWRSQINFSVLPAGLYAEGRLDVADNVYMMFRRLTPLVGLDLTQALDIVATAQWGAAGNNIVCEQMDLKIW